MSIALEMRGLRKRYTAGSGACLAAADILRGVDLVLRAGEVLAIVGPRGSGKTTLMLCAAGLLRADAGDVYWFGESSRASAFRRTLYHHTTTDLLRSGAIDEPHVHLLDFQSSSEGSDSIDSWVAQRRARGDSVLIATPAEAIGLRLGARTLALRAGQLHHVTPPAARVAEPARDGPSADEQVC